jgi:hypothetical protein
MFESTLEILRLQRAIVEASVNAVFEHEHLRHEAMVQAFFVQDNCGEVCGAPHDHIDGEELSEAAERQYESYWADVTSAEDLAFRAAGRPECGSIRLILVRAEALAKAILAANKSGCESKLYGIHRIEVD